MGTSWRKARNTWNRRDVREINRTDLLYEELKNIKLGIHHIVTQCPHLGSKDELTADDCANVYTYRYRNARQQNVTFTSYASSVFASIRHAITTTDEQYTQSMCPSDLNYLTFTSNSKSGQHFYLSNDKRYFLKTEKRYYVKSFIKLLRDYLKHFITFPHSLIVKYVGVYSVSIARRCRKYILVMQNIFYPSERVEVRYDLKACLKGRYETPVREGDKITNVLKDVNFDKQMIELGSQANWFISQVRYDLNFMRKQGVVDYSLLIGKQLLQEDEKTANVPILVRRLHKSTYDRVQDGRSFKKTSILSDQLDSCSRSETCHVAARSDLNQDKRNSSATQAKWCIPIVEDSNWSITVPESSNSLTNERASSTLRSTEETLKNVMNNQLGGNRRLLNNSSNALHVIDGERYRYFVGFIDFFTHYEMRQKLDRIRKTIMYRSTDHSSRPPGAHARRLLRLIRERTV